MTAPAPYNAILGFPNWTPNCTVSGGSWQTAYPAANMLSAQPIARVGRSTDATLASTQATLTLDTWRSVGLVVLCRHSLTSAALVRVRTYYDTGCTNMLADSGWVSAWGQVYTVGSVAWEWANFWTLTYASNEITGFPWHIPVLLPAVTTALAVTVEVNDTVNPAGSVDIGYIMVANVWQTSVNFDFGASFGFPAALTVPQTAMGGADYFDHRDKPRGFQGTFTNMTMTEVKQNMFELYRVHDIDLPFFWWPNPTDGGNFMRDAFPARIDKMQMMTYSAALLGTFPISMKEAF